MWEWSRGVMVRGRVVEIGGLIDREFQTLRSTVELGSRSVTEEWILALPQTGGGQPHPTADGNGVKIS